MIFRWLDWKIVHPRDTSLLFQSFLFLGCMSEVMAFFYDLTCHDMNNLECLKLDCVVQVFNKCERSGEVK